MTAPRAPKTPASALPPVAPRRAARTVQAEGAGQPASASPIAEAGPTSSSLPPDPGTVAMDASPVPGTRSSSLAVAGNRAEAPRSPAGGAPGTDGVPPDRSGSDERAAQRKDWKAAQSAHNAARRRGRVRRAPKATGPGMIRRMPQAHDRDCIHGGRPHEGGCFEVPESGGDS